jgi:UDP-N-acetylmuramyl pentapeptide phosphotransferase/UDP-N-acetylglucosamine-1-phosphate transferase
VYSLSLAFVIALVLAWLIIHSTRRSQGAWNARNLDSVQKFHAYPVPRVGGLAVAAGIIGTRAVGLGGPRRACSRRRCLARLRPPPLLARLAEDVTKKLGIKTRLLATALADVLAAFLLGAQLRAVQLPGLDRLMTITWCRLLFTALAVAGVANAVNIIDGYNDLASVVAMITLLSLAHVGLQVGDSLVVSVALGGIGALLGFFVWNWPRGLIFLGDGGAYFVGYLVAVLSFLLVARHLGVVSPWYPFLLFIYPVFETRFSIWRKRVVRGDSPGAPDGLHLHMLIFRRLVRWAVGRRDAASLTLHSSLNAPYLWLLSSLAALPAMSFGRSPHVLQAYVALLCVLYVWLFLRLVRLRAPRWLVIRSRPGGPLSRFKDGL